jgi:hypothetical protein
VFQKTLILGQLTENTTNTTLFLLGLQSLGEGVVFPFTI